MDKPPVNDQQTDLETWHRALAGDPAAREQLLELAARLAGAQMRSWNEDDRAEVQQMVAQAVLEAFASKFVPTSHVRGFLHWRARSQISNYLRGCVQDRKLHDIDQVLHLAGYEEPSLDFAEREELREAVEQCIRGVPNSDHREAFRQRFLDGKQPMDIAAQHNVPPGRMRVWIARAAEAVRACLTRKLKLTRDSDS